MPLSIDTQIEIDAPPLQVWRRITAFNDYQNWNPLIDIVHGELVVGGQFVARMTPPGTKPYSIYATVRTLIPNRKLSWQMMVLTPGLFDFEHQFEIIPINTRRVRFNNCQIISGLLSPIILKIIGENLCQGFEDMNIILKNQVEHRQ